MVSVLRRKRRRRMRGRGREKKRRAGARKKQLKTERQARCYLRILFWNCGSLKVRKRAAELLASSTDIICLQETQHTTIKPDDFQPCVTSDKGHGQIIAVKKGISFRRTDVARWSSDDLHIIAVELIDQPVRNIVNVYACN